MAVTFSASEPMHIRKSSGHTPTTFQYWTVSPAINGVAFIGERNKFVTASARRFTNVEFRDPLTVTAVCVPEEVLEVCCWKTKMLCDQTTCDKSGVAMFSF